MTFANYRGRDDTCIVEEGQSIVGLQVNTKSHPDHISRLGFVVWGEGEHKRTPKKVKETTVSKNFCKDLVLNFVFLLFSIVPFGVALYFISVLTHYISKESQWLPECTEDE